MRRIKEAFDYQEISIGKLYTTSVNIQKGVYTDPDGEKLELDDIVLFLGLNETKYPDFPSAKVLFKNKILSIYHVMVVNFFEVAEEEENL